MSLVEGLITMLYGYDSLNVCLSKHQEEILIFDEEQGIKTRKDK